MSKPTFYTQRQYYKACEEKRILERNIFRKQEEAQRALSGRKWP